jgi:hypothetical protein
MGTHGIRIVAPDGAGKREMLRSLLLRCNVGQGCGLLVRILPQQRLEVRIAADRVPLRLTHSMSGE